MREKRKEGRKIGKKERQELCWGQDGNNDDLNDYNYNYNNNNNNDI